MSKPGDSDHQPCAVTIERLDTIDKRLRDIFKKQDDNGKKLSYINGDVQRNNSDIRSIKGRLRKVENNEILQEGIEKGKGFMKTSTRNMLIIIFIALGCLFAGINTFKSGQKHSDEKLEKLVKVLINNGGVK